MRDIVEIRVRILLGVTVGLDWNMGDKSIKQQLIGSRIKEKYMYRDNLRRPQFDILWFILLTESCKKLVISLLNC